MLEVIERLLILQDRDRKLRQVEGELARIEPQRKELQARAAVTAAKLEIAKQRSKQIETDRKGLELEVGAKKQLIERYANQQLQTRKNEEYRALTHEIDTCKAAIFEIEDREIAFMEQAEAVQKEIAALTAEAASTRKLMDEQVATLGEREQNLSRELQELKSNREQLSGAVEAGTRGRYERLLRSKGENVVVGVQRGVCGGCHMRLQPQLLVMCQADKELVTCGNCGRILYYTPDMDLAVAE